MTIRGAHRAWQLLEPIHAVTYFAPESLAALREAGYRGYWMGYFAARAAPLGAVGPDVVRAVFYNFAAHRVAGALPDAWSFAPPQAALEARAAGADAALRRMLDGPVRAEQPTVAARSTETPTETLSGSARLAEAAELALRIALDAPPEGRPLFAANRALPVPAGALPRLWHAATLLREHRGDGHNAALLAAGVGGAESHVLAALGKGFAPDVYRVARDLDGTAWQALLDDLRARGLVGADGLTEAGRALRDSVEVTTDRLAAAAFADVPAETTARLFELLQPVTAAVVAAGDIPVDSPMGLDLRESVA